MNEQLRTSSLPVTTQAAEGLPRRRWTVAEIEAMVENGILLEDERFELIGGEAVPMSPKGNRHEVIKAALQDHWVPLTVGSPARLIMETTLRVAKDAFFEPDFLFWPRSIALKDIATTTSLLIVEVADTSLGYDLGIKAAEYARLGLREFWVINARTLSTTVHTDPGPDGYRQKRDVPPGDTLVPLLAPQLAVCLGSLELG